MAKLELGMISSTWFGTEVGTEEGIRKAKEIGFDTYDIFEDPLDIDDADAQDDQGHVRGGRPADPLGRLRRLRARRLQPVGAAVHARPHQGVRRPGRVLRRAQRAARRRRVLLGRRGLPARGDLGHGQGRGQGVPASTRRRRASRSCSSSSRSPRRCSRTSTSSCASCSEIDHPAVRANADISHLHLSDASFDDVAKLTGLIGHIHLSDCDGKVHGDMPAGMGVTPIKEYLAGDRRHRLRGHGLDRARVRARGHARSSPWAQRAYDGTAAIMSELGVR